MYKLKEVIYLKKPLEEQIIESINKKHLRKDESMELIENLYWADWTLLKTKYPKAIDKIFNYLKNDKLSNEEISAVLKLYNNPEGAYIEEFSHIILNLYKADKTNFIKSLNIEKEEAINLVYMFRNHFAKVDEDKELLDIVASDKLSEEEKDTAETFMKMYKNVCST